VLEAVFVLLEFPSPSRRIFIGSHSLPPSLVRRIGPSFPSKIMADNTIIALGEKNMDDVWLIIVFLPI
jgi:hypothetical protein